MGFYRGKKSEKHNNSWHLRFNSHFKVFLISSLAFSYKHHNQNTFVCFDFQNSTTPKDEKISLQPAEVTSMLQLLLLHEDHPVFADFPERTTCSSDMPYICSGRGQARDRWMSRPSLAQRTYLIVCNWDTPHCWVPLVLLSKGKRVCMEVMPFI